MTDVLTPEQTKAQNEFVEELYKKKQDSFLDAYVDYAKESTDAPLIYHRFMAYSVLSVLCNRNIYVQWGHKRIYPNLWIILIGKSSKFRKSTSMDIAEDILYKFGEHDNTCSYESKCPDPKHLTYGTPNQHVCRSSCAKTYTCNKDHKGDFIYPNDFSKEALFGKLSEQPRGIFTFSEFASLTSSLNRDYNLGTKELLTDLYDCPYKRTRILKSQTYEIYKAYINIVSGTTIDWLVKNSKEDDFRAGFLSRFLYVPAIYKSDFKAVPPPQNIQKKNDIVKLLGDIVAVTHSTEREIVLEKSIDIEYHKWAKGNDTREVGEILDPVFTRYDGYCIKLAMLQAINQHKDKIEYEHFAKAKADIENLKSKIAEMFETQIGFSWIEKKTKWILLYITEHGRTQHSELLHKSHLTTRQFKDVIATLTEMGSIKIEKVLDESKKPVVYYTAKGELV
jgi:hypothetical protein